MPSYNFNPYPYKPTPAQLIAGKPEYVFGSYNDKTGPTIGTVISDAVATDVATVVFQILSGNVPVVGAKITIEGAQNTGFSSVSRATILSVSVVMLTGICTVTFALSASDQPVLPDLGQVVIPQPEISEAVVNGPSVPVAAVFQNAQSNQGRSLTAVVSFPVQPFNVLVTVQSAVIDEDSEYADVATVTSVVAGVVTGGQVTIETVLGRFYRLNVSGVAESSPAPSGVGLIGKFLG